MKSLISKLEESKKFIQSQIDFVPQIGLVLGSGFSHFIQQVKVHQVIPYEKIPHFLVPKVASHKGELVLGYIDQKSVAILSGRIHYYEGYNMNDVVYAVRALGWLGVKKLILTNAAGSVNEKMQPGDFMVIKDHINLMGHNPLRGSHEEKLGPRFPDVSHLYNQEMIKILCNILSNKKIGYHQGVYCAMSGPCYETAAEIQFVRTIGGHAVGMSTVPEALAAHHMGLLVCGISCITNLCTGIKKDTVLTHEEVVQVGKESAEGVDSFLREFVISL